MGDCGAGCGFTDQLANRGWRAGWDRRGMAGQSVMKVCISSRPDLVDTGLTRHCLEPVNAVKINLLHDILTGLKWGPTRWLLKPFRNKLLRLNRIPVKWSISRLIAVVLPPEIV